MPTFESVSAYLAAQPPAVRRVLAQVRAAIRKALPQAYETISYSREGDAQGAIPK